MDKDIFTYYKCKRFGTFSFFSTDKSFFEKTSLNLSGYLSSK